MSYANMNFEMGPNDGPDPIKLTWDDFQDPPIKVMGFIRRPEQMLTLAAESIPCTRQHRRPYMCPESFDLRSRRSGRRRHARAARPDPRQGLRRQ